MILLNRILLYLQMTPNINSRIREIRIYEAVDNREFTDSDTDISEDEGTIDEYEQNCGLDRETFEPRFWPIIKDIIKTGQEEEEFIQYHNIIIWDYLIEIVKFFNPYHSPLYYIKHFTCQEDEVEYFFFKFWNKCVVYKGVIGADLSIHKINFYGFYYRIDFIAHHFFDD